MSDDEEPVDVRPQLQEECKPKCPMQSANYDACKERIKGNSEGDCEAWFFDLMQCVDNCVSHKIFHGTK
eukprot:CAMPEP_0196807694 /NCGR_PEP_ID=MMETSP1362-20130617/7697_1 /TAXON_ID=163516 /ORGANISM="Leptocylindrus danicus, Strain CCMP1856" /LENGTH=68 /DNA_ID=CAMNT_0042181737 /DNA_START=53 /DNA_END=259 /DNA_ORIENTATION=+